jgi:rhodanese-related sulfurtransferase
MAIPEIDVDALAALREHSDVRLIDVREPDEYETARVPGAVSVPLATVPEHVDRFRGDGPTYVICQAGGRSLRACEFVAEHGIDVVNVAGGTGAWIASGRDVDSGSL